MPDSPEKSNDAPLAKATVWSADKSPAENLDAQLDHHVGRLMESFDAIRSCREKYIGPNPDRTTLAGEFADHFHGRLIPGLAAASAAGRKMRDQWLSDPVAFLKLEATHHKPQSAAGIDPETAAIISQRATSIPLAAALLPLLGRGDAERLAKKVIGPTLRKLRTKSTRLILANRRFHRRFDKDLSPNGWGLNLTYGDELNHLEQIGRGLVEDQPEDQP
jgi:hypothetical protein